MSAVKCSIGILINKLFENKMATDDVIWYCVLSPLQVAITFLKDQLRVARTDGEHLSTLRVIRTCASYDVCVLVMTSHVMHTFIALIQN